MDIGKSLRVLKFGGSSLANADLIHRVAKIISKLYSENPYLLVVVSAMGKSTDGLLQLAREISPRASHQHPRELDMMISVGERISMSLLSMAIRDLGIEAVSLTGSQSGIITSEDHGNASILEIRGDRIRELLLQKKVVIVAGFQGVSRLKEITTLGRGGSDTSAMALAHYFGCRELRIYSDVDAYFSADPKKVPAAIRRPLISWELAFLSSLMGARVLHERAAALAAACQTRVRLLSTFNPQADGGLVSGCVSDNSHEFQVVTVNMKMGLQKLTTINHGGLDKARPVELVGISPLSHIDLPSKDELRSEIFDHFVEGLSARQGVEKNFSSNETEYCCLSLVGTALRQRKLLLDEVTSIISNEGCSPVAYLWNDLLLCLIFQSPGETKLAQILQNVHSTYI